MRQNNTQHYRLSFKSAFDILICFLHYVILLLWNIIVSNIHVALIVLSPKINISPVIMEYKTSLNNNFLKVVLANSITLTPGTLTIKLTDESFTIHCLDTKFADDMHDLVFEKILKKMEGIYDNSLA